MPRSAGQPCTRQRNADAVELADYETVSLTTRLSRGPPTVQSPSPRCKHPSSQPRTPIYIRRCVTPGTGGLEFLAMNDGGWTLREAIWVLASFSGAGGTGDVMWMVGRSSHCRPSVTIRTDFHEPEKRLYPFSIEHRAPKCGEAARTDRFPQRHQWAGSTVAGACRQVGNAVPVPLARAIGAHLAQPI